MSPDECEHIDLSLNNGDMRIGRCKCLTCQTDMALYEGLQCLFNAMKKRIGEYDAKSNGSHKRQAVSSSESA